MASKMMATKKIAMASEEIAMASNLIAMASNVLEMAFYLRKGAPPGTAGGKGLSVRD